MDATNYTAKNEQVKSDALVNALRSNHQQIKNIAEIIQRVRPDVVLLNEFDYIPKEQGIEYFKSHYLNVGQNNQAAIDYPYVYIAPVNTGLATEFDLDNNGKKTGVMGDAQGFGFLKAITQWRFYLATRLILTTSEHYKPSSTKIYLM